MKKKNILLLTDDYIYLKHNGDIIKTSISKDIIKNSKVANIDKFNKCYTKFIKKNNLNNSLFGDIITIVINNTWTNFDIVVTKNILSNLNYRRIEFIYDYSYYHLTRNNAYLEIHNDYMIFNYLNDYKRIETILITSNMFSTFNSKMDYIASKLGNKELYILGYGEELQMFFNTFEDKYNIETYIYSNNETYLLDNI